MPSPKDITEALSQRKIQQPDGPATGMYKEPGKGKLPERKLSPDLFSAWVYFLLLIALLAQLGILASIDILDLL